MQSDAAPQSVHSSCWTNGTVRLPLGKPSFLRAGNPSVMECLVAMGGESLRAMASVGQVLLEHGQERDDERLGEDLDLHLGVHAVVEVIGVVSALERASREACADGDPGGRVLQVLGDR